MKMRPIIAMLLQLLLFNTSIGFGKNIEDLKILHISLHKGCISDFQNVANILNLNVTPLFLHEVPRSEWDQYSPGATIYNIGHDRAKRIWDSKKDYFNQFDIIMTSDTTPLCRIFLQNGWKKPLVVWVCNRFDYYDGVSNDCDFPDQEYYNLIRQALSNPTIQFIPYTKFESYYAHSKGIIFNQETIKPLGWTAESNYTPFIPLTINKPATFFIPDYENNTKFVDVKKICSQLQIPTYSGRYSSPEELVDFKGIIHMPYAWSNLFFFENIKAGLIHFVPSANFIKRMLGNTAYFFQDVHFFKKDNIAFLSEWYDPEHKEIIVEFDSWDDLKHKIETIDYAQMKTSIKNFSLTHQSKTLNRWKNVFSELAQYCV